MKLWLEISPNTVSAGGKAMIIWGSRTHEVPVAQGECYCPRCGQRQPYQLIESKRYFTLYFISLFPMYSQGQHVACLRCAGTFSTDVLSIGGPPVQQQAQPSSHGSHSGHGIAGPPAPSPSPDTVRQLLTLICGKTGRSGPDAIGRIKELLQHSGLPIPADDQLRQELQMAVNTPATVAQFAERFVGTPEDFRKQMVESAKWVVDDGRPLSLSERQVLNQLAGTLRVSA